MKKYCYVLSIGSLSKIDDKFHFYDIEVFTSKKKVEKSIKNRIEINKGSDVVYEDGLTGLTSLESWLVTYNCLNTDGKEMRVRYVVRQTVLK